MESTARKINTEIIQKVSNLIFNNRYIDLDREFGIKLYLDPPKSPYKNKESFDGIVEEVLDGPIQLEGRFIVYRKK